MSNSLTYLCIIVFCLCFATNLTCEKIHIVQQGVYKYYHPQYGTFSFLENGKQAKENINVVLSTSNITGVI